MSHDGKAPELPPIVTGSIGGFCAAVVSFPIDTLKVRVQTGKQQQQFSRGIFSGFLTPIFTVTPQWSALHTGYSFGISRAPHDAWWRSAFAGLCAAVSCSFIFCPMQAVKCTAQVQKCSSLEALRIVWHFGGLRKGMYRGYLPTLAYELPGYGIFFLVYDSMKQQSSLEEFSFLLNAKAACIASVFESTAGMPGDTVRTRYQTNRSYKSVRVCAAELFRIEGVRGFYRGYSYRLVLGAVVNGVALGTIEVLNRWWAVIGCQSDEVDL